MRMASFRLVTPRSASSWVESVLMDCGVSSSRCVSLSSAGVSVV